MAEKPIEFPDNPQKLPKELRQRTDFEFEDLVRIMDRLRRTIEYNNGSINQEDASASGSIQVAANTTGTVTITPEQGFEFIVSEVGVNPNNSDLDYNIQADDISTDANNLFFATPFIVRNRIQIEITNSTNSAVNLTYFTNARQVRRRD